MEGTAVRQQLEADLATAIAAGVADIAELESQLNTERMNAAQPHACAELEAAALQQRQVNGHMALGSRERTAEAAETAALQLQQELEDENATLRKQQESCAAKVDNLQALLAAETTTLQQKLEAEQARYSAETIALQQQLHTAEQTAAVASVAAAAREKALQEEARTLQRFCNAFMLYIQNALRVQLCGRIFQQHVSTHSVPMPMQRSVQMPCFSHTCPQTTLHMLVRMSTHIQVSQATHVPCSKTKPLRRL